MIEYDTEEKKNKELFELYEMSLRNRDYWLAKPLIDPRVIIPPWPRKVSKLIKQLGDRALFLENYQDKRTIFFPGGKVMYCPHPALVKMVPDIVTIYGATSAPGVRSLGTENLDTKIIFTLLEPEVCKCNNIKIDDEIYFHAQGDFLLKVDIENPKDTNIKNYWVKE